MITVHDLYKMRHITGQEKDTYLLYEDYDFGRAYRNKMEKLVLMTPPPTTESELTVFIGKIAHWGEVLSTIEKVQEILIIEKGKSA